MTFISYAQNYEDVILWRALKHVNAGFYIDIGAQDPIVDSVSLAFYERGWRGAHVEPVSDFANKIREARPEESVFELAIGKTEGTVCLFEIANTGMSTCDPEIALMHEKNGHHVSQIEVVSWPLHKLLDKFADREIHWLKLDVEGAEKQVIESWQPSSARPWVLSIEGTKPNLSEPNHHAWDSLIIELGYTFAYFDGLNRYYVSEFHPELLNAFGPGPNIFDDFVLESQVSLENNNIFFQKMLNELRVKHENLEKITKETRIRNEILSDAVESYQAEIAGIYNSKSWKVTAPLRFLKFYFYARNKSS
jgi:FkbM family methyltransferase